MNGDETTTKCYRYGIYVNMVKTYSVLTKPTCHLWCRSRLSFMIIIELVKHSIELYVMDIIRLE